MILYEDKSHLDEAPVVAIATGLKGNSTNPKTGQMVQVWILRADLHPVEALRTEADASICGSCPHRPKTGADGKIHRTCYVNIMGPSAVYRAYRAGMYPRATDSRLFTDRKVRIGAYGDPAAVPYALWEQYLSCAAVVTGYTHEWRACDPRLARYCMASCDSERDFAEARRKGWRSFRVRTASQGLLEKEVVCPASKEGGRKVTCFGCGVCNGHARGFKSNIVIIAHGIGKKAFNSGAVLSPMREA